MLGLLGLVPSSIPFQCLPYIYVLSCSFETMDRFSLFSLSIVNVYEKKYKPPCWSVAILFNPGRFWSILSSSGRSCPIWVKFWSILANSALCWTIISYLYPVQFCPVLSDSGRFWSILSNSGRFWFILVDSKFCLIPSDSARLCLTPFDSGQFCLILVYYDFF